MADSGGSQFSPKAADGNNGGAAGVSYAENLAERLLSDLLTGRTRHKAPIRGYAALGSNHHLAAVRF